MSTAPKAFTVLGMTPANMTWAFGKHAQRLQNVTYAIMSTICPDYSGGLWELRRYTNGSYAFVLNDTDGTHEVTPRNGYTIQPCTLEAISLAACLIAYSQISIETFQSGDASANHLFGDYFHGLRDMLCGEMNFILDSSEEGFHHPDEEEVKEYEKLGTRKEREHPENSQILSIID